MTAKELLFDKSTLLALGTFALSGGFFLFITVWRVQYLRWVAAEHRFIKWLGIPDHVFASTRRMEESRGYVVAMGVLAFIALALLIGNIAMHIHYGRYWGSTEAS